MPLMKTATMWGLSERMGSPPILPTRITWEFIKEELAEIEEKVRKGN